MDARQTTRFKFRWAACFLILLLVLARQNASWAAQFETKNFTVDGAPTLELAKAFCETAERCRYEMALLWLGETMPDWSAKCPIKVEVGRKLGAGGATSFIFQGGEVYGWEMDIQGSAERILDSVLPHELTHMIFASHFRRPVPRWLDEGAATSVECEEEKENYRQKLRYYIRKDVRKCFPCRRLIALKEYPEDVIPFYAQGFSIVEYLLYLGGHRELVRFVETGIKTKDWDAAFRQHYGFENLGDFQAKYWVKWVAAGSPSTIPQELHPGGFQLAAGDRKTGRSQIATANYTVPSEEFAVDLNTQNMRDSSTLQNLLPSTAGQAISGDVNFNENARTLPPSQIVLVSAKASPAYGKIFDNDVYNGVYSSNSIRTEVVDSNMTDARSEPRQQAVPISTSWNGDAAARIPAAYETPQHPIIPATVYDSTKSTNVFR